MTVHFVERTMKTVAQLSLVVLALAACARDISLPAPIPNSVSGRVVVEEPGTGRTLPATGARVEWVGTGIATTADGQTGRFRFDLVPPAPRKLWIQWSSNADASFDRERTLNGGILDSTGAVELGDLGVAQNAEVHGRVLLADKPQESAGHAGTVVFVPRFPFSAAVVPGGAFFLPGLPAGTLSLGFFRPGYAPASIDAVALVSGGSLALRDVVLSPLPPGTAAAPGGIKGSVRGTDGAPAASASLSATPSAQVAGTLAVLGAAGADGAFLLSGLAPGPYAVLLRSGDTQALVGGVLVLSNQVTDLGQLHLSAAAAPGGPGPASPPLPIARAGADQTVPPSANVLLDGAGSAGDLLVFHWTQTAGGAVTLSGNDSSQAMRASFVAPSTAQALRFALVVEDRFGQRSVASTTSVFLDAPPAASLVATPNAVPPGGTVLLDASGSSDPEPGDVLAFSFSQSAGPLVTLTPVSGNPAKVTFIPSQAGAYAFQVLVSDGHSRTLSNPAAVVVSTANHAPVARATVVNASHPGRAPLSGDDILLDGQATSDPDPGQALSFSWSAPAGGPGLSCTACAAAHVTAPALAGTYRYLLSVTDDGVPPLGSSLAVAFSVSTTAVTTSPSDGAAGVSPLSSLSVTYNGLLQGASVATTPLSVTVAGVAIAGTQSYGSSGGQGQVTWRSNLPLPADATVNVAVPVFADADDQPSAPAGFSFRTRPLAWQDRSPPNPHRADYSVSSNDVGFSSWPFGPSLATGPLGTFLAISNWYAGTPGAEQLLQWNGSQWTSYLLFQNANGTPTVNSWANGAAQRLYRRTGRSYLGLEVGGQPVVAYDQSSGDSLTYWAYSNGPAQYHQFSEETVGMGASIANDGTNTWLAAHLCRGNDTPYLTVNGPAAAAAATMTWNQPATGCSALAAPALSQPSIAGALGQLFLAVAYATPPDGAFQMNLFSRAANESSFNPAGVLNGASLGLVAGGILNGAPVNGASMSSLSATPRGPVLVFLEFPGGSAANAQIRALRFDVPSGKMVDPLGAGASSLVLPSLADSSTFNAVDDPVVTTVGLVPYVAFIATNSAGGPQRVYVAHADAARGRWVLDPDNASAFGDGSLNVNAGCSPATLSIALMEGKPTVAWSESCAIPGEPVDACCLLHSRNLLVVKRLE